MTQSKISTYEIKLFSRVCEEFNLGILKNVFKANGGFSNSYYGFVTNKSKYSVKVYTMDKLKTIISTAKAELFFKKGGIPVLTRINNLYGGDYSIIDGSIYVVFPYIFIPKIKKWQKELYYELGNFLGKMHGYSIKMSGKDYIKVFNLEKIKSSSLASMYLLLDALQRKEKEDKHDKLAISNLVTKIGYLRNILGEELTLSNVSLIHGDFHPGNLCIKDNKIKMIYDFDSNCFESIYYELAKVIINTCFSGSFNDKKFIRTERFLVGYQKHVLVIPPILRTAIKICYFEIFSSLWAEEKFLKKPSKELSEIMNKEKRTLDYFINISSSNDFTERICGFLNK